MARRPEDRDVDVAERAQDPLGVVAVGLQVAGDLGVRVLVGDGDGATEVGEERDVGHHRGHVRDERGRRDGDPATLAAAGDRDARRVHERGATVPSRPPGPRR